MSFIQPIKSHFSNICEEVYLTRRNFGIVHGLNHWRHSEWRIEWLQTREATPGAPTPGALGPSTAGPQIFPRGWVTKTLGFRGLSGTRTHVQLLTPFAWLTTRLRAMTVQQFTLAFSMLTQQLSTTDLTYSSFTFHMILHKLLKYEYLMTTCLHMAFVSDSHLPPGEPRGPGGVVPPLNPRGWKFKTWVASLPVLNSVEY